MFFGNNALVTCLDCLRIKKTIYSNLFVQGRTHYSLSYRFKGTTVIEFDGKQIMSGPGTLTYVPINFSYNTFVPEQGEMIVVHFNLLDEEAPCEPMVITPDDTHGIMSQFMALYDSYSPGDRRNPNCLSLFYGIVSTLEKNSVGFLQASSQAQKIKQFIDKHITDSDFGVSTASTALGISDSYMRRVFRDAFGISPCGYIKSKRMEIAKSMLLSGYYSISEVSSLSGFESVSYFSAEFRRKLGCSPREFINENKK